MSKNKGFDLAALNSSVACDKGAEIEILDFERNPTGIFITVLGKDSQVFREHVKQDVNARLRREALANRRGKESPIPTAEEAEEKATELLILCTVSWRQKDSDGKFKDTITYGDQELAFSVANCKLLYETLLPVRRQVDEAIGDLENFT